MYDLPIPWLWPFTVVWTSASGRPAAPQPAHRARLRRGARSPQLGACTRHDSHRSMCCREVTDVQVEYSLYGPDDAKLSAEEPQRAIADHAQGQVKLSPSVALPRLLQASKEPKSGLRRVVSLLIPLLGTCTTTIAWQAAYRRVCVCVCVCVVCGVWCVVCGVCDLLPPLECLASSLGAPRPRRSERGP